LKQSVELQVNGVRWHFDVEKLFVAIVFMQFLSTTEIM
jgi:hypothetical protein